MRTCEDFEKLLPAYVAGVADPADVAEIGEHIGDCQPCMEDFQRIVRDLGVLKSWREPVAPDGLASRVLERLADAEERRKSEVRGAEIAVDEPFQNTFTVVVLSLIAVVMFATLVTAQTAARREEARRACAENLRQIGVVAVAEPVKRFAAPLETSAFREELLRAHRELLVCPVAGSLPPAVEGARGPLAPWTSYRLNLPGPTWLACDRAENHGGTDANLLMNDGTVITVTPAQAGLWQLLDPYSPGR
ncbi:MAG: zf-HC2 domain-containing protein [Planctomycetia bacterium]|nr:zf-HC2 domain-containing protein [Planctomycetia bacterium]